jgi:hypothetical protein
MRRRSPDCYQPLRWSALRERGRMARFMRACRRGDGVLGPCGPAFRTRYDRSSDSGALQLEVVHER